MKMKYHSNFAGSLFLCVCVWKSINISNMIILQNKILRKQIKKMLRPMYPGEGFNFAIKRSMFCPSQPHLLFAHPEGGLYIWQKKLRYLFFFVYVCACKFRCAVRKIIGEKSKESQHNFRFRLQAIIENQR